MRMSVPYRPSDIAITGGPFGPTKNKMAYFFSALESEARDHGSEMREEP